MAVAYDNSSVGEVGSGNSLTFSLTTSGADRRIDVGISTINAGTISSVTYNGVALALLGTIANPDTCASHHYRLVNAATGANNVVISTTATGEIVACAVSTTGADQSGTPEDDYDQAGVNNGTTHSLTLTSATGGLVLSFIATYLEVLTVGASQTTRSSNDNGGSMESMYASTEPGAASVTMSWTSADAAHTAHTSVAIKAAAGAAATSLPPPPMLGIRPFLVR